jgi:hypothetical protein
MIRKTPWNSYIIDPNLIFSPITLEYLPPKNKLLNGKLIKEIQLIK